MPSEKAIVHVIDDDEAIRQSLAFLLQAAKLEVKTYSSAMAFLDALPDATASCVITDVRMPGMSGVDLLRRLKELKIGVPVIVITGHGDVALAVEAMKVGAVDFLEKPFDDDVLLASVQSALKRQDGETKRYTERLEIEGRLAGLSNRERDVLGGLVAGRANKQIAFDLGISPRTVEIYRANLMNKMKAGSLSDLVRMALIVGIVGPEWGDIGCRPVATGEGGLFADRCSPAPALGKALCRFRRPHRLSGRGQHHPTYPTFIGRQLGLRAGLGNGSDKAHRSAATRTGRCLLGTITIHEPL